MFLFLGFSICLLTNLRRHVNRSDRYRHDMDAFALQIAMVLRPHGPGRFALVVHNRFVDSIGDVSAALEPDLGIDLRPRRTVDTVLGCLVDASQRFVFLAKQGLAAFRTTAATRAILGSLTVPSRG